VFFTLPYFRDLTPYSFLSAAEHVDPNLLNVGWLSRWHSFSTGVVETQLLEKLLRLCRTRMRLTRGVHRCDICNVFPMFMTIDGERIPLRNGEIRVLGTNGKVYASPTLICHYIDKHGYCLPAKFLDAVGVLQISD
jgi:hypothetical protein